MPETRQGARLSGRPAWIAGAVWLAALMAGGAGVASFLRHEEAELSREVAARCITTVDALNQTLLRTIEAVDRVHLLQQARHDLLREGRTDGARAIGDYLADLTTRESFGILQVGATDAGGVASFSSIPGWAPIPLPDPALAGAPLVGRIADRWSLQFTQPLRDTQGRFAGVSAASLDPILLSRRLAEVATGEGTTAAVMRLPDGALLARSREAEAQLGRPPLARHPAVTGAQEGRRGGLRMQSQLDGRPVMMCYRQVPDRPMVLVFAEDWAVVSQSFVALQRGAWSSFAVIMLLLAGGLLAVTRGAALRATRRLLAAAEAERAATAAAWARLEHLLEAAPVAIYAGRMTEGPTPFRPDFTSPNLRRVTGWEPHVFLDPAEAQGRMEAAAAAARGEFHRRVLAEGRALIEYRWRWPDGSWRWLREEARRITPAGPDAPDIVGYLLDVTEQRETAAWAAASARLTMLGELAANMAHELNQPLAVISLAAENAAAALEEDGAAGIPDALETLDLVAQQAARCKEVVRHLRLFSSPDQRQALADVPLGTVVQGAMLLVRGVLRDAGITLHNRLPATLPPIRANAVGAEQVFVNLFLNARDALAGLPPGAPREIWITARVEAERLCIRFADSGGGIPPDVLPRIFEPFFTTKGSDQGTGLGLAICQSAMRGFGGEIRARNEGPGAEFTLEFPLAQAAAAPQDATP
jgi:C4-dicarboxylate-specific signal transduction histidine kinase